MFSGFISFRVAQIEDELLEHETMLNSLFICKPLICRRKTWEEKWKFIPSYRLHNIQQQRSSQIWAEMNECGENYYGQTQRFFIVLLQDGSAVMASVRKLEEKMQYYYMKITLHCCRDYSISENYVLQGRRQVNFPTIRSLFLIPSNFGHWTGCNSCTAKRLLSNFCQDFIMSGLEGHV